MAWPADGDRRLVAVAFWATLLLPLLPALAWGIEIHGIWTMSNCSLLPILLLSCPAEQVSRQFVRRIIGFAIAVPLVMLIAAPGIALFNHERGLPPEQTQARTLAAQVENTWHDSTAKPLRYVGGETDLVYGVLTYVRSRPQLLLDPLEWHAKRVKEYGIAFVCFAGNSECIAASSKIADENPASRKIETQLVRNYFGIPSQPGNYMIFIVPPDT